MYYSWGWRQADMSWTRLGLAIAATQYSATYTHCLMQVKPCDAALVLTVPDDVAVRRLVGRLVEQGEGEGYDEEALCKRIEVQVKAMNL